MKRKWSEGGLFSDCEYLEPVILFISFFLIIATYSVAKPMKGALVMSEFGVSSLPLVWLGSAALIGIFVTIYGRLVDRYYRNQLFMLTVVFFGGVLILLRFALGAKLPGTSIALYLWGDIFSVVLVEQFWSLSNDLFDTNRAKRWYGFIASGAVLGGIAGSAAAYSVVHAIGTMNLIFVCVAMLSVLPLLVWILPQRATVAPKSKAEAANVSGGFALICRNSYLIGIMAVVVLTQVGSTLIDYQFSVLVESAFQSVDSRTQFIAQMTFWVSTLSLVMMWVSAPVQKHLGVRGGLMVLPFVDFIGTVLTLVFPVPMLSVGLKVADKGLNYSTQRVSKEILYIPTSHEVKYKVKSIIDMFAYRFSKAITSALIIPFTYFLRGQNISYLTLCVLLILMVVVGRVSRRYYSLVGEKRSPQGELAPALS